MTRGYALDDYIADYAPNLNADNNAQAMMAANRLDAPDGKLYKIGLNKGYWDSAGLGPQRGYYIRWDLYQQLGYPQITTTDELCEVLAQMQALEPQNKSGQPTYAAGAWNNGIPDSILWPQALMMGYSTGPDNILAVDIAGLLHRLAAGGRAAQTMHADLNEQRRGLRRGVQNIAENGVFGNGHGKIPP